MGEGVQCTKLTMNVVTCALACHDVAPRPPSKFWGSSCCYGALPDKIRTKGTCTPIKASAISASPAEIVSGVEVPVISTSVPVSATLNRK